MRPALILQTKGKCRTRITDLLFSSFKDMFETMIYKFIMEKVIPAIEYLRKTCPKAVLLTILVSLMIIETTTDLPDEGKM